RGGRHERPQALVRPRGAAGRGRTAVPALRLAAARGRVEGRDRRVRRQDAGRARQRRAGDVRARVRARVRMSAPFERSDVALSYESWYETAYGRLVDRIETGLILERLAQLPPGASLLEIGCGTGWFGRALAQRGFRVAGLDPSVAMLARAQGRFPLVRGDAARLPFAERSFD